MSNKKYHSWLGLDLRRDAADSDPRTVREATNVSLTNTGAWRRRDGLRKICDVDSNSVGLYSANGSLRTVVPGGQGLQDLRPAEVIYDPVGNGAAYALGSLSELVAATTISAPGAGQAYPYVSVKLATGAIEHHWLNANPATALTAVSTKVTLPFDPGRTLQKIATKIWTDEPAVGSLRFCSTVNGPTDWTATRDAGILGVRQHAGGEGAVKGLTYFNNQLVVAFADSMQLWQVFADPAKNALDRALGGPGTETPGALANVLGDVFYFSRGGFRSLAIATQTGVARESDVGSEIQALTELIDALVTPAIALWSQSRQQYLCVFGTTVYVFTLSPAKKIRGWSKWTLPFTISALVEHEGDLYVRAGNAVYLFDKAQELDDDQYAVNWSLKTQFLDADDPGAVKRWKSIDVVMTGTAELDFYPDVVDQTLVSNGPTLDRTSYFDGIIPIGELCENISIGFSGTKAWQLDSFTLYYDETKGSM